MNPFTTYQFRKMPVRIVRKSDKNYFVIRDICNILGWSNPNRELQVVRLVPRADVEKLLAANSGHKALLLERYLRNEVFPKLDAEEKAAAQVRALIVGFISTMHTLMTEQYFADRYHGGRNDRRK